MMIDNESVSFFEQAVSFYLRVCFQFLLRVCLCVFSFVFYFKKGEWGKRVAWQLAFVHVWKLLRCLPKQDSYQVKLLFATILLFFNYYVTLSVNKSIVEYHFYEMLGTRIVLDFGVSCILEYLHRLYNWASLIQISKIWNFLSIMSVLKKLQILEHLGILNFQIKEAQAVFKW